MKSPLENYLKLAILGAGDNGNVMSITNNLTSARAQTFSYDALNRIWTAQTQGTSGSNCFGFQFAYDAWANLTATSILSGYTSCAVTTPNAFSISVDGNNHLTTSGFSYDLSGNVLNDGVNSYAWNAESETKTAAGVNYTYDGLGDRVEKSNGTLYWYGPGGEVLDETDLSGNLKTEYVFLGGKRVAERDSSGIHYYVEDHLGSSRVMTTSTGTKCYDADFLPFGQEVDFTSTCGSNYKFESKERDLETGNDNFGARYYRSALGRWQSPDWSAIPAPVPYANLSNPQTLNLYAMTSDNPETFADLDGHAAGILEPLANFGGFGPDQATGEDVEVVGYGFVQMANDENNSAPAQSTPQQPTTPPQSPTGAQAQQQNNGVPVKLPNGSTVPDKYSATGNLMSPTANLRPVVEAGENVGARYGSLSSVSPILADVYLLASLNHYVGHSGAFDYQRSGGKYLKQFRDVSNFNVGLFAHGAGLSLQQTLKLAGGFARAFSSFGKAPVGPHGVPLQTEQFIRLGWTDEKKY